MTDISEPFRYSTPDLSPCDQELFMFARRIGIAGGVSLLVGATGMIAVSDQTPWTILHSLYLALIVLGPIGLLIAQKIGRILMKHYRKQLSVFNLLI